MSIGWKQASTSTATPGSTTANIYKLRPEARSKTDGERRLKRHGSRKPEIDARETRNDDRHRATEKSLLLSTSVTSASGEMAMGAGWPWLEPVLLMKPRVLRNS